MGLVKFPVNIMNHMSAEATAGNISFSSATTMTVWTQAEYLMILILSSGLLGNVLNFFLNFFVFLFFIVSEAFPSVWERNMGKTLANIVIK